jgi:hypothetical protein
VTGFTPNLNKYRHGSTRLLDVGLQPSVYCLNELSTWYLKYSFFCLPCLKNFRTIFRPVSRVSTEAQVFLFVTVHSVELDSCEIAVFKEDNWKHFFYNLAVVLKLLCSPFSHYGDASAIRSRKKSTTLNLWRVVIASWSRWWEKRHYELKVRPVGDCTVIFSLIE